MCGLFEEFPFELTGEITEGVGTRWKCFKQRSSGDPRHSPRNQRRRASGPGRAARGGYLREGLRMEKQALVAALRGPSSVPTTAEAEAGGDGLVSLIVGGCWSACGRPEHVENAVATPPKYSGCIAEVPCVRWRSSSYSLPQAVLLPHPILSVGSAPPRIKEC